MSMLEGEIGTLANKVVAQTDPSADTETLVESIQKGFDLTIKEINFVFTNVVDAKAMTGFIELVLSSGDKPYRFPVGFGTGGAATASVRPKGHFDVNIKVPANTKIELYATMNENTVGMWIGLKYKRGLEGRNTYGDCNTAEDAAISADTLTDFSTITIPPLKGGRIKAIIVAYGNVVNAKSASGYVELAGTHFTGSHRYPVGGGSGGATNCQGFPQPEVVDVDIPVKDSEIVTPSLYLAEAGVDGHVGIMWESDKD